MLICKAGKVVNTLCQFVWGDTIKKSTHRSLNDWFLSWHYSKSRALKEPYNTSVHVHVFCSYVWGYQKRCRFTASRVCNPHFSCSQLKKNKYLVQLNVDYKLRSFAHLKRAIHNQIEPLGYHHRDSHYLRHPATLTNFPTKYQLVYVHGVYAFVVYA